MAEIISAAERSRARNAIDPSCLYRWAEFKAALPIGESLWRAKVANKKAPQPIKLGRKCTLWRGSDVLEWLDHPDSYTVQK